MNTSMALAIVAAVSITIRVVPIVAASRFRLTAKVEDALRHAGMGALVALVLLEVSGLLEIAW